MKHPHEFWRIYCKHCGEVGAALFGNHPDLGDLAAISPNFTISPVKDNPAAVTLACAQCRKGATLHRPMKDAAELKWARKVLAR